MKTKVLSLVFKKLAFCVLIVLLLSSLSISGCSPSDLIFGPSGSIEITTNPSGAEIFLEGKDTSYVTPHTITNLTKGTYEVTVILGDVSYTETVIVYSNHITSVYKDFHSPHLEKINVLPWHITIILSLGNTVTISSVTAYYSDYSSANIPLTDCIYSSSDVCAIINSNGAITGISEGVAIITVSYTEGGITKTDTVLVDIRNTPVEPTPVEPTPVEPTPVEPEPEPEPVTEPIDNKIVYRALCVGVGDYIYGDDDDDLLGPPYDVDRMIQIFNQCQFGPLNTVFSTINYLRDWQATKSNILQRIASTFSGADNNDISYFYYSGHGYRWEGTSYLCPADSTSIFSLISVNELEAVLSAILGTKVVFLDTCHSGGFIGKGKEKITISKGDLESFNDEIISIFSQAEYKGLLTTNQYKVLTSCHYYQGCWEIYPIVPGAFDPYGVFTMALYEGCGYSGSYPADTNLDTKVSLQEAYLYVRNWVAELIDITQDVQVYPNNSTYPIVEY